MATCHRCPECPDRDGCELVDGYYVGDYPPWLGGLIDDYDKLRVRLPIFQHRMRSLEKHLKQLLGQRELRHNGYTWRVVDGEIRRD